MEFLSNKIYSAVTSELIGLDEAKTVIKIDSTDFNDNISVTACVTGGYHAVTATATGTGVNVSHKTPLVILEPIAVSAGGTLVVKLQESLDDVTYTDVDSWLFSTVSTANATVIQQKAYTGDYSYIRAAYTIATAEVDFSVNVILSEPTSVEDDYITDLIVAAREYAEDRKNMAIGEQKWKMTLRDFPDKDYIELPISPLRSVDSVTYINSDGVSAVLTASESTGYIVDTESDSGRIVLAYGVNWPVFTPYPYNAIEIIYTCGYTLDELPKRVKDAMLKLIGLLYANRENGIAADELRAVNNLLGLRMLSL